MKNLLPGMLGTLLLAAPVLAQAQTAAQWIVAPPGFVTVLVPDDQAAGPPAASLPAASLPVMPDPQAMIRQMDAMMQEAEQNAAAMQAQFAAIQTGAAPSAGVVITTISDGVHSCTQRVTYPGNGGRPDVVLTATANGCALNGIGEPAPVASPTVPVLLPAAKQAPAAPKLIEAKLPAGEVMLADRN